MKRDALLESKIRPFATKLADDVVALIETRLETQLERAGRAVIDALRTALDGDAPPPVIAPRAQRSLPAPKPSRPVVAERTPGIPSCSKCGQPGHNARSCGREPKGHRAGSKLTSRARDILERTRAARSGEAGS